MAFVQYVVDVAVHNRRLVLVVFEQLGKGHESFEKDLTALKGCFRLFGSRFCGVCVCVCVWKERERGR
jgi:hypothetical protein